MGDGGLVGEGDGEAGLAFEGGAVEVDGESGEIEEEGRGGDGERNGGSVEGVVAREESKMH